MLTLWILCGRSVLNWHIVDSWHFYLCRRRPTLPSSLTAARCWCAAPFWGRHRCRWAAARTPRCRRKSTLQERGREYHTAHDAKLSTCIHQIRLLIKWEREQKQKFNEWIHLECRKTLIVINHDCKWWITTWCIIHPFCCGAPAHVCIWVFLNMWILKSLFAEQ